MAIERIRITSMNALLGHKGNRVSISAVSSLFFLVILIALPLFLKSFVVFQVTMILVYGIAVLALNILTGASGQFSLGQSAFYAVGAYTTAILMSDFGINYALTLPVAALVCFMFGFLFGFPALRLSGTYLALATFALAAATPQLLKLRLISDWTGGVQGKFVPRTTAPFDLSIPKDTWLFYFTLFVAILIYVFAKNLLASRTGRAFMAIRDNEIAASSMGINVALYKTLAFGISSAITGVAGSLSAIVVAYVAPDSFTIVLSLGIFLGMIIGGVGWLPGSLVGATFILYIPNFAESISKGLSGAVYGVTIFFVIFLMPAGSKQVANVFERSVKRVMGW